MRYPNAKERPRPFSPNSTTLRRRGFYPLSILSMIRNRSRRPGAWH